MKFIIKYKFSILGVVLGGAAGYLYYYFIGCASSSCAISSNPINITIYGMLIGVLLLSKNTKK